MNLKQILLLLLLFSLLIGACACSFLTVSSSDKVENAIYAYLENKYPNLEFEIKGFSQDTYTSGRYVFYVYCADTSVDFTVYHSSFLTTDSYSVVYANLCMEQTVRAMFSEEFSTSCIDSVQWNDVYTEGYEGYRFRDMDIEKIPYAASEISEIYRFTLTAESCVDELEAAEIMKEIISRFDESDIDLQKIVFQLKFGKDTVLLTTDAYSVQNSSLDEFNDVILHIANAQNSDEAVKVFYGQDLKKAEYFLTEEDKNTEGNEENIASHAETDEDESSDNGLVN